MTLGEFKTLIREEIKRANTLDSLIPSAIRRAARWMERKLDLEYMTGTYDYTLQIGDSSIANFPNNIVAGSIKEILALKWFATAEGEWKFIERVDEEEAYLGGTEAYPTGYWTRGHYVIYLNRTLSAVLPIKMSLRVYSTWITNDADSHWLLDNMEDAMIARTCMYLAPAMRDEALFKAQQAVLAELLPDVFRSVEDAIQGDRSPKMHYGQVW